MLYICSFTRDLIAISNDGFEINIQNIDPVE